MTSPAKSRASYERHKQRSRQRQAAQSAAGRDIAPLPAVRDPQRKARARRDFRFFANTYLADWFTLPFSRDHDRAIAKAETAVKTGGLFALAMPRGSGKTTLLTALVIWAVLCGWHQCVVLVAANATQARKLLRNVQTVFETNDLLLSDFPEAIYPIRALARVYNRKAGQTYGGQPTRMEWTKDMLVLPSIPASAAGGAMIVVAGIESGNLRGVVYAHPDGTLRRPTLVFLDDPQTRRSASSALQNQRRAEILGADVLFMAGPGQKIAGLCSCTVVRKGDMADQVLDSKIHPEWHGERAKMLYALPAATDLWDQYAQIRSAAMRGGSDGREATDFYAARRAEMDAGADVAWPERHHADELSGLQHAMNLYYRDRAAFFAECQNEPVEEDHSTGGRLVTDQVAKRTNGRQPREIPQRSSILTAYVDVHDRLLYWLVSAWEPDFTGYLLDYGTSPDQSERYFSLTTCRAPLAGWQKGGAKAGPIYAGVTELLKQLLSREYRRDDGTTKQIDLCLVNSGYMPDPIARAIRALARGPQLLPSIGMGLGPNKKPLTEYNPEPGVTLGRHWRKQTTKSTRLLTIEIDANRWRSTWRDCLTTPIGEPGAYTLFGDDPQRHQLWADHQAAQIPTTVSGPYGDMELWKLPPDQPDDHWFDCGFGAACAAAVMGCALPDWANAAPPPIRGSWWANQKKRP